MIGGVLDEVDLEYATAVGERARQGMSKQGVPPTPDNYHLWFNHEQGTSSELSQTIRVLVSNKRKFDAATNRDLFQTYIDVGGAGGAISERASERLRNVLGTAKGYLTAAISDRRHVEALEGIGSTAAADGGARKIIANLVAELSDATGRATTLEDKFEASSKEVDKVRQSLEEAEARSNTDTLTGLANRRGLDVYLRTAQMATMESGEPMSVFLIDIDHFKSFNDRFGHQVGDQVLRLIAKVLRDGVRDGDLAARFGGEELTAVLPGADLDTCWQVADRVRQSIAVRNITRRATGEVLSNVTVSIGVAQFRLGEPIQELIERCDRALYLAKRDGRNRTATETELNRDLSDGANKVGA